MDNNKTQKNDHNEKTYIFDNPKNIKRLLNVFYVICVLLVILDLVIHRHVIHSWESLIGFYPLYGFVSCVILVFIAAWMRKIVMRDERYYDDQPKNDLNAIKDPNNKTSDSHVDD